MMSEADLTADTRTRILSAAAHLLDTGGRDALTTRAVAEAANVQAPTLYRLFGDKSGLLDAVTEHGFAAYLKQKQISQKQISEKQIRKPAGDPIEDLRIGWDLHIEFGLTNPALYLLMYADPQPGRRTPAAETSYGILRQHIRRVAASGRLRLSEERAAHIFHAAACGIVLLLLGIPPEQRDMELSRIARDAALAVMTTEALALASPGPAAAAITLRAVLPKAETLSLGERVLLKEWLDRLALSEDAATAPAMAGVNDVKT